MPYCPNGHGQKQGRFCDECAARLVASPPPLPAAGDSVRVRSPDARADVDVNVSPTIVMPGRTAEGQPALVRCPLCGRRNPESDVFDCMGPRGRQNLCLRHFDEEHNVCRQCAAQAGRTARRQLGDQLSSLQAQAREHLEKGDLAQALLASVRALELAREDVAVLRLHQACEEQLQHLVAETQRWRETAQEAQAHLERLEERKDAAGEARKQAAEVAKQTPQWQQIGIEVVTIPAGEFLYGRNLATAYLPEYCLTKTPVTNAQYRVFVEAAGCRIPDHWSGGQIPREKGDHPVVCVSWHDARAFCEWAECRLPTELEWEKAARGTDGREYPWGNVWQMGRCNTQEVISGELASIAPGWVEERRRRGSKWASRTTPVTRYSPGASPYGLLDMAGNVSEWCKDSCDSGCDTKVLRGGSWSSNRSEARCVSRFRADPELRYLNIGFRCCVGPMPSP